MSQTIISITASVLALALVLVLAWLVIKALAMFNKSSRSKGLIKVVDSLPVGARERILVVTYKNSEYLLASSSNGISLIDRHRSDTTDIEVNSE